MARKSLSERIDQKKIEAKKIQERIQEDQNRFEELEREIKALESEQVLIMLDSHNMSVKDLNELLKKQSEKNSYINHK